MAHTKVSVWKAIVIRLAPQRWRNRQQTKRLHTQWSLILSVLLLRLYFLALTHWLQSPTSTLPCCPLPFSFLSIPTPPLCSPIFLLETSLTKLVLTTWAQRLLSWQVVAVATCQQLGLRCAPLWLNLPNLFLINPYPCWWLRDVYRPFNSSKFLSTLCDYVWVGGKEGGGLFLFSEGKISIDMIMWSFPQTVNMVGYTLIYFQILHQPDKRHGVMVYCSLHPWLNSICCSVEGCYILTIEINQPSFLSVLSLSYFGHRNGGFMK